ncbi:NB-ARC domain-containing protein [Tychonema sp. LEGE 06208]|uniref:NB-ARC domain-containing protein n=1 Tax=Tychonema sp. LEGE 06208 TaxID=1828663 RepID=UPI00187FCE55|nr:NB-ARC domain-containing protein [Tychonema sp. LEGE 06208]MBE9162155.1 ATPase [Tychonema sp. LEGE 06208]
MDVQELLKFADGLVFTKIGKHLDDLQQAVVRGTWQGKRYSEISKEVHCTERHVRNVASKLWQTLSEILDEDVMKSNLRSTMERYEFSKISNSGYFNLVHKGNINVCTETPHPPTTPQNSPPTQTSTEDDTQEKPRLDLRDAPELRTFYNYPNSPLTTLENSIARQNCRLLTITGMAGTGKSAIARNLIPQIQSQFDRIIWLSLRTSPPLETTLKNLIQFLSNQPEINIPANTDTQLSILIETLRENRCLIVLDDVQQILSSGQLAGNYKPGYENYGTLFKLIGEIPHNSCLILNSWEPPSDILTFTDDNSAVRLLQLTGLGEAATEILRDKGLLDEEHWPELINLYQGNPLWLKLVAQTINNLFNRRVSKYLSYQSVFLGDELTPILQQHYQRLSEIEKQAISQLSNEIEPVSFTQWMAKCQGSQGELCKAIQSLARRGMIEKLSYESETVFTIPPVLKQYVKMVAE